MNLFYKRRNEKKTSEAYLKMNFTAVTQHWLLEHFFSDMKKQITNNLSTMTKINKMVSEEWAVEFGFNFLICQGHYSMESCPPGFTLLMIKNSVCRRLEWWEVQRNFQTFVQAICRNIITMKKFMKVLLQWYVRQTWKQLKKTLMKTITKAMTDYYNLKVMQTKYCRSDIGINKEIWKLWPSINMMLHRGNSRSYFVIDTKRKQNCSPNPSQSIHRVGVGLS